MFPRGLSDASSDDDFSVISPLNQTPTLGTANKICEPNESDRRD